MDKSDKPFYRKGGKSFHKDRKGNGSRTLRRRKLEPGVEFEDRTLGVGIVRKVTEDGITVAFGDVEKVIPRRKRDDGEKFSGSRADGKPFEKKVFTFDTKGRPEDRQKGRGKDEVTVGLSVVDEKLGKGVVSRITERGVYVTYEATGEHVMYPQGLPAKLKKSAFPERKREKRKILPKGKGRTYRVPEQEKPEPAHQIIPHRAKETHRGNTRFIDLGEGTMVFSPDYGEGVITAINHGHLTVEFRDGSRDFAYPAAFAEGQIIVPEKKDEK